MQVQATQHVHLIAVRYVEDSIRKASHYRAPDVAFHSLIERGVGLQMTFDPSDLVEKILAQSLSFRLIGGECFLDFGLGGRLVDDPSGHLRSLRDQLAANVVQSDADFIRIRPMMGQAVP